MHNAVSSALGQVEAVIGVDGPNSILGTMMSDLRNPASGGGGHVQVANKGGTGQTTFTKGDILVAQSTSVLTKLAVGNDGQVLGADSTTATGIAWGAGSRPTIRVYSTASVMTWTRPSNLSYVVVEVIGGGGGGGAKGLPVNFPGIAGGGASGAYSMKIIAASSILASQTMQIGAGGGPGITSSTIGSVGGLTTFGSFLTVSGGSFGASILATSIANPAGAAVGGSVLVAGNININGDKGGIGVSSAIGVVGLVGGIGGNTPKGFGFGGRPIAKEANGVNGIGYGAGGSGASYDGGALGGTGGTGVDGAIIVTEY